MVPGAGSQPQAVAGDRDTKVPDERLEPWQVTAGQTENKPETHWEIIPFLNGADIIKQHGLYE